MKKTFFIITTLVLIVIGCEKEPIELTDPEVYPLKYIYNKLDREEDLVYVITDDAGNYQTTKSDPLANDEDAKYVSSNDYISSGGISGITLSDLSNAKVHDGSGAYDMTYKIKGNELILSQVQGQIFFNENKYKIKSRLAMVAYKLTDGKFYGISGGFKYRRFGPFLGYNLEDLIKREISISKLKKNDTLYITEYWANFEKD